MSPASSNDSRLGRSWLEFLKQPQSLSSTPRDTPRRSAFSLVQSVASWAATSPDAAAITTPGETLSYAQLETQSNALARHLLSLGATSETLVALVLDRSPDLLIAALAAWKAGAAYLPVDPSSPPERIRFILQDAHAAILIRSGLTSQLEFSQEAGQQVDISDRYSLLRAYSSDPLPSLSHPSQLAYVIYTSGSTGSPKGVQITHENLLNLVHWHQSSFAVSSSDRATMFASPGFDAAVWEIWPYLSAGATLLPAPDATRLSPRSLRDWMVTQRVTLSFIPTPIAQRLISLEWPTETALRFLFTGADVLQQYPRPGLPFTLVNNYGPTECTVVALSGVVTPHQRPSVLPPIGRPIANTKVFLLDENLQPVPQGSVGELYIAGAGVGRGYLGDPVLTRQKFLRNPFDGNPAARMYKTGDLARSIADGAFEFLGRTDDQVKIRGFRVEPSEVCIALCAHPAIQSAVVLPFRGAARNPSLVAYVVLNPDVQVHAATLRKHLQARLPDYMLPNAFVVLESLPLNANGKVDRSALPAPNTANCLKNASPSTLPQPTGDSLPAAPQF